MKLLVSYTLLEVSIPQNMVDDVDSRYVYCLFFERRVNQSSTVEPIGGNQQLYRNMGLDGLEHVEYTAFWNPKLAKNFPTSLCNCS